MKNFLKKIIPAPIFRALLPVYHFLLAWIGAIYYGFPSRSLFVAGVTGTKGKTSTTEILNMIFEEVGYKTALINTIRFKIGSDTVDGKSGLEGSTPNLYKMSMPGRFFIQNFLWKAKKAGCTHVVLEITSEGARQFRNKFIDLDAFIFTNLSPEHIESHGSYEKYRAVKIKIAHEIEKSRKKPTFVAINADDPESFRFMSVVADKKVAYSLHNIEPYSIRDDGIDFTFKGVKISSNLRGLFNIQNILAAASLADAIGISPEKIRDAVAKISGIKGRVEYVKAGQDFDVVVDYAHTPDSLEKLYGAFAPQKVSGVSRGNSRKLICVLGNTGGGRDTWKRPEMAKIADHYCDHIILTNEDPYDEDPQKIVDEMKIAIAHKPCEVILDRRLAIARAIALAKESRKNSSVTPVAVLISGKGTDPYIMGPNGTKISWSDVGVVKEELVSHK